MPVTVLVPNARCQVPRTQLNFYQVVKSIMILAALGQRKSTSKQIKSQKAYIFVGEQPYNGEVADLGALGSVYEMEVAIKRNRIDINKEGKLDQFKFQNQQKEVPNLISYRNKSKLTPHPTNDMIISTQ